MNPNPHFGDNIHTFGIPRGYARYYGALYVNYSRASALIILYKDKKQK